MAAGNYYPPFLGVDCPTHGPRKFEMSTEHELYVCPDRHNLNARVLNLEDDYEGVRDIKIRIVDPIDEVFEVVGGCFWVVRLEDLINNPDGGDPIQWGGDLSTPPTTMQGSNTGL